jgi:hypothetical protein
VRPARPDDSEFLFLTRRDGFRRYVEQHKAWDERKPDHWWVEEIALVASERARPRHRHRPRARDHGRGARRHAARHIYDRLGFRVIAEEDVRVRMEWP